MIDIRRCASTCANPKDWDLKVFERESTTTEKLEAIVCDSCFNQRNNANYDGYNENLIERSYTFMKYNGLIDLTVQQITVIVSELNTRFKGTSKHIYGNCFTVDQINWQKVDGTQNRYCIIVHFKPIRNIDPPNPIFVWDLFQLKDC